MTAELVALACCDLGGMVRGRFVAAAELDRRPVRGVGWVPGNLALTPFDQLVTPNAFGSTGDLRLVPGDGGCVRVELNGGTPYHVVLCDLRTPDGEAWDGCPRGLLAHVVKRVERELGGTLRVAFEHEFALREAVRHPSFSVAAVRALDPFATELFEVLTRAGLEPEALLAEFGRGQLEVPCRPTGALEAADRAVHLRELVREVARRHGHHATFAPLLEPGGATSGVHIHLSLDGNDGPAFHDVEGFGGLSPLGGSFAAGILAHAAALTALTAPSAISALRLTPGCWSAGSAALGLADRESLVRIPSWSTPAAHHLEYRGADGTASPYLALAALLIAGALGVQNGLTAPTLGSTDAKASAPLPGTLAASLEALKADGELLAALPALLRETYLLVKLGELAALEDLGPLARCQRYAEVY